MNPSGDGCADECMYTPIVTRTGMSSILNLIFTTIMIVPVPVCTACQSKRGTLSTFSLPASKAPVGVHSAKVREEFKKKGAWDVVP